MLNKIKQLITSFRKLPLGRKGYFVLTVILGICATVSLIITMRI